MKKTYQKPQTSETILKMSATILAGSPTGTNMEDLDVDQNPTDAEGHARRRSIWDDED